MSKKNKHRAEGKERHGPVARDLQQDPQQAFQQAVACYGVRDWKAAESLCRQILGKFPEHVDALHLLGAMLLQSERFDDARLVLDQALALQPRNPAIANKLGIVCTHLKRSEEALAHFCAALEVNPQLVEVYAARGALHESMGQHDAAARDFAKAVELAPEFALGHFLWGNCQAALGQPAQAVACYDRALALASNFADALHARGNAWRDLDRIGDALSSYEQAIQIDPNHFAALSSMADLLVQQSRHDAALEALDRVIRLKPDYQDALVLRGALRYQRSELDEAYRDFARLVELDPANFQAYLNIGHIHFRLGRFPQALGNYGQALRLEPDDAIAHLNRSMVLAATGAVDEAFASNARARALAPEMAEVICNEGNLQMRSRQLEAAARNFRRACEMKPEFVDARSSLLYALNFMAEVSPEEVKHEATLWNQHHAEPLRNARYAHVPSSAPRQRLRLGYVSSDLRHHVVANFMAPILANHDAQQFEVFCYHCHPVQDEVTQSLSRGVEHWVNAATLSAEALARRIHEDGIDVLVDLAGHSEGNRLLSFALKPAPVQITYLGYPGTTGLEAMDCRISDVYADPPEADVRYTEQLLRLPHSLWCYRPAPGMPAVGGLPALDRGHLTFGSFNSFSKVDRRSIELWAQLMIAVPDAQLVVATVPEGQARVVFLDQFASLGVDASRIELLGKLSSTEFWGRLERVDISLDPVSVNGATTTCESLWLGVPVISRVGSRFLERAGLSILTTAGLPDFACASDDACVQLVQRLSSDWPRLAALRAGLRAALQSTPLTDAKTFTRSLEGLYRTAWLRWAST